MKIEFDYRFDENGFFDNAERRVALERAGEIWSNLLQDDFEAIPVGSQFSTVNPTSGAIETIVLEKEIDDLLIFVGGGSLSSSNTVNLRHETISLDVCSCSHCSHQKSSSNKIVNLSQPGVLDTANSLDTDSVLAQAQVNGTDLQGDVFQRRISANFRDGGAVSDFEPWAGSISFNPGNSINWSFDLEDPDSDSIDFISVALHEIGHILGIGVAPIFDVLGAGGSFSGANALAANDNSPIPLEANLSHVREGFKGNSVLLDPLLNENRSLPSDFDLALLADIGYEIAGYTKQGFTPDLATNESEQIIGSNTADEIDGLLGDDSIQGNEGNDTIAGNAGNDTIFGTAGNDWLAGSEGEDSLHGGVGSDTLDGGSQSDLIVGAAGADLIFGGAGDDELQGNEGADTVRGGSGNDLLFGQGGADVLVGDADNDRLQGSDGNDSLQGSEGNDTLLGEAGADILEGGSGDDLLVGGEGSDRFFFGANNGNDIVNDFAVAQDKIQIASSLGFSSGSEVLDAITSSGNVANNDNLFSEITLSTNNTIQIFHDSPLEASNFAIVEDSGIRIDTLEVVDFARTVSGFTLSFSESLDTSVLDLSDFSYQEASTGTEIPGSLIWNETATTVSFIKSGGILESDSRVMLFSDEDSFVSASGQLLDGDANSIPGGDFSTEFVFSDISRRAVSIDDFIAPPGDRFNEAVSLSDGENVTQAQFTLTYNPSVLAIEDISLASELADWTLSTDLLSSGVATVSLEGSALSSGAVDLLQLELSIPDNASDTSTHWVSVDNVVLNNGSLASSGDIGLQIIATANDLNGDGSNSDFDSYLVSQMAAGLSDRFEAFPTIDPLLLGDVNGDGVISAIDSYLIARS